MASNTSMYVSVTYFVIFSPSTPNLVELQLKESLVHLVPEEEWLNPLGNGLSEHTLSLDADTGDTADDNVSVSLRSCHQGVDVTG